MATRKIEGRTPGQKPKDPKFFWYPMGVCAALIAFALWVLMYARC